MATNVKKSLLIYPLVLVFVTGALLISSCKDQSTPPKDGQVCISLTNDPNANKHFMPKDSIDIYRRKFDSVRRELDKKCSLLSLSNCETFSKDAVVKLLQDSTITKMRIYYGIRPTTDSTKRSLRLIIVGVDKAGNDVFIKNPFPGQGGKKEARELAPAGDPLDGGLEYGQCDPPCTN
jgi:hypothetical protein